MPGCADEDIRGGSQAVQIVSTRRRDFVVHVDAQGIGCGGQPAAERRAQHVDAQVEMLVDIRRAVQRKRGMRGIRVRYAADRNAVGRRNAVQREHARSQRRGFPRIVGNGDIHAFAVQVGFRQAGRSGNRRRGLGVDDLQKGAGTGLFAGKRRDAVIDDRGGGLQHKRGVLIARVLVLNIGFDIRRSVVGNRTVFAEQRASACGGERGGGLLRPAVVIGAVYGQVGRPHDAVIGKNQLGADNAHVRQFSGKIKPKRRVAVIIGGAERADVERMVRSPVERPGVIDAGIVLEDVFAGADVQGFVPRGSGGAEAESRSQNNV